MGTKAEARRRFRGTRLGLLVVGALAAAALTGTSVSSYRTATDTAATVAHGEAEALQVALRERYLEAPLDAAALARFVEAHVDDGLRRAAVYRGDALVAAAGSPLGEDRVGTRPGVALAVGTGIRLAAPSPPHFRPPDFGPGLGPPPGPPPFERELLVVDLEPVRARALLASAEQNLLAGLVTALLLLVASGLAVWLGGRAEQAEAQAERHRHLATLGEMSATLAHELRNPLAALKGHAQLLVELGEAGPVAGEQVQKRAGRVVTEAVRLEQLTTSLLDLSRAGEVSRRPADPAEVLREAVQGTEAGRVDVYAEGAPGSFSLDPLRMRQVLTNLLLNALQAAPDARVEASVGAVGHELVFTIRDHGPGVPTEERARIFEAFHTKKLRGTGLGLAVAKRITELHGGRIEVDDHPEGGAVFRVCIPEGG